MEFIGILVFGLIAGAWGLLVFLAILLTAEAIIHLRAEEVPFQRESIEALTTGRLALNVAWMFGAGSVAWVLSWFVGDALQQALGSRFSTWYALTLLVIGATLWYRTYWTIRVWLQRPAHAAKVTPHSNFNPLGPAYRALKENPDLSDSNEEKGKNSRRNLEQYQGDFMITWRGGLHARPAAELVRVASRFRSEVFIGRDELEVDAKSVMGVMMLAAECGVTLHVRAVGADASEAVETVIALARRDFGMEMRMGPDGPYEYPPYPNELRHRT